MMKASPALLNAERRRYWRYITTYTVPFESCSSFRTFGTKFNLDPVMLLSAFHPLGRWLCSGIIPPTRSPNQDWCLLNADYFTRSGDAESSPGVFEMCLKENNYRVPSKGYIGIFRTRNLTIELKVFECLLAAQALHLFNAHFHLKELTITWNINRVNVSRHRNLIFFDGTRFLN